MTNIFVSVFTDFRKNSIVYEFSAQFYLNSLLVSAVKSLLLDSPSFSGCIILTSENTLGLI